MKLAELATLLAGLPIVHASTSLPLRHVGIDGPTPAEDATKQRMVEGLSHAIAVQLNQVRERFIVDGGRSHDQVRAEFTVDVAVVPASILEQICAALIELANHPTQPAWVGESLNRRTVVEHVLRAPYQARAKARGKKQAEPDFTPLTIDEMWELANKLSVADDFGAQKGQAAE